MVSSARMDGSTQTFPATVRKTIQSIKEIVGNHSDADIYVALRETDMDPNETTQKLLNQDTFHEVKRRRDRKKEPQSAGYKGTSEPQGRTDNVSRGVKFHAPSERAAQRINYPRNTLPGVSREFRVVRDNRANHIYKEVKPPVQHSTSTNEQLASSERGSSSDSSNQKSSVARKSSQVPNGPSESHTRYSDDAVSNAIDRQGSTEEKQGVSPNAALQSQPVKPSNVHQNSVTVASASSAVGVYSSSTDPVHVPSPDSRSSGAVGAIGREVGVVGVRRHSSDNSLKQSSVPSSSYANSIVGKDVSRSFLNSQYNNRQHQQSVGHQRVSQHNKEWKPKSSQKLNVSSPGVIGAPIKPVSPAEKSEDIDSETAKLQDKLSQVKIFENQNVIIAKHIRVPETDRCQLTFGTIGTAVDSSMHQPNCQPIGTAEKSNEESVASLSVPAPELTNDVSGSKQVDIQDDHIQSTGSDSPASAAAAEPQLPDNKESSRPHNLDSYVDVRLVQDNRISYAPSESQLQQDSHDMPGFSAYDAPTGYDMPYLRQTTDETVRGQGLPSAQEGYGSHNSNNISPSTIPMVQQPPVAQIYPQVHVSHFSNLMPFRQFLSPVYVPPMPMPGYSSNPPYPHPSNGNSYLLMPGGGSHLNANSIKYGVQQFKPVPSGSPTGFGNFTNPTGYAMNAPGMVGGATALEDSSRIKYKDNLYVPNPQAETSEIWIQNPRELPSMQSPQYYNMPGQTPHHAAYMPSHANHASFNAAAAQSSHMQYPAMYHASPQPAAMASPHHHIGPAIGNNVGVGVAAAAPGAQVGAYQQPQMGHLNWTTNF
ncbi:hypothetical protein QN277_022298 [Acacia crassicarpa]|uniref:GBF-interacting protein 1 N-terminal domain-containing protein n=1 Tax=Acacia crassicarpa TaxID=499986 RepID=A0AAE1MLQ2_9FABA|nr:hypothetical protein QN277_022298 [Acacia crassicarpa]